MQVATTRIKTNSQHHLTIGGVDALQLADTYQTPLVVYDVDAIREQIHQFQQAFAEQHVNYVISYASKALAITAIYQVLAQEQVHVDVVSGGELYTAMQAHFPMKWVSFHGNNKSMAELEMALQQHVGVIIVDNFYELQLLQKLASKYPQPTAVMLRINPGITAHTHEYDQTGQEDSKFGFDWSSGQATRAAETVLQTPSLKLVGIHAHIGSQILGTQGFKLLVQKLGAVMKTWEQELHYRADILNFGGGFGIQYTKSDQVIAPRQFVQTLVQTLRDTLNTSDLPMPTIWIEPGRALVGPAGYNLYTIGARKDIPGYLPYVSVDGGMGDNLRPALYQAQYEAVLARAPQAPIQEKVRLSGRYCESGDILISQLDLPATKPGDVLAMLDTGAYGYSMASNYNRVPRPAVVFAEQGRAQEVVRRESFADLTHLDQSYNLN